MVSTRHDLPQTLFENATDGLPVPSQEVLMSATLSSAPSLTQHLTTGEQLASCESHLTRAYTPSYQAQTLPFRDIQDTSPRTVPISSSPDFSNEYSSSPDTDSPDVATPADSHFAQRVVGRLSDLQNEQTLDWLKTEQDEKPTLDDDRSCSTGSAQCVKHEGSDSSCGTDITRPSNGDSDCSITHTSAPHALNLSRKRKTCDNLSTDHRKAGTTEDETDVDSDLNDDTEECARSARSRNTSILPSEPLRKKLKRSKAATSFTYDATETASARRAKSLDSSKCSSFASNASLIPTEPATPIRCSNFDLIPSLPIIAPPDYALIPRAPVNREDVAEARLATLLAKEKYRRSEDGLTEGLGEDYNFSFGMDIKFRRKVARWLLSVLPSQKLQFHDLRNHLIQGDETRFHAIMLFNRYFLMVGDGMPTPKSKETPLMRLGRERITWDVAVSCLALSVKFHQDFLRPFSAIHAHEFLALAPHPMSHDDFEICQKDVLEVLRYEIRGVTPEPFMQEIRLCLTTLRKILDFENGWEIAQQHAWLCLRRIALEADVLRFPISILTAVAIVEGAVESLITKYERDMLNRNQDITDAEDAYNTNKAHCAVQKIIEDMKDVLNMTQEDLRACHRWLCTLFKGAK